MMLPTGLSLSTRNALAEALPNANFDSAVLVGEGYGLVGFRVPDPTGDWAVRIPQPQASRAISNLKLEAKLLPSLENAITTETPRKSNLVYDNEGTVIAAIHRFIDGNPPSSRSIRGARRERLAAQIATFFKELHSFSLAKARRLEARTVDLWPDLYQPLITKTLPHLGRAGRTWLKTRALEFERGGATAEAPRVLIHGDIAGEHLLLDADSNLAGVIDFGDAMIADPALDFAGILNDFSWPFLERLLAHYGPIDSGLRERARFYIDVVPIFQVQYGEHIRNGAERLTGIRRISARARYNMQAHSRLVT
tara:strand:+ start:924 stop:1850 length:927 start_codon:yes stop_codon:yes gene_type:complete